MLHEEGGGGGGGGVEELETGHTVVDNTMVSVVKYPFPGQFVMVGAQEVFVYTVVV